MKEYSNPIQKVNNGFNLQSPEADSAVSDSNRRQDASTSAGCVTTAPQPPHTCLGLCLLFMLLLSTAEALRFVNNPARSRQPLRVSKRDCALTASRRLELTRGRSSPSCVPRRARAPCLRPRHDASPPR